MTKLLMSLFISTLAVSSLTASVAVKAFNGETPSIEVKGQASILAMPDRFTLSMAITKRGRFTDKIRTAVENKSNQVIDIARSLGVKSQDINSATVVLQVIKNKPSIILEGLEANKRLEKTTFLNSKHNNQQTNQYSKVYVGVNGLTNQENTTPLIFELTRTINIHFASPDDYDLFLNKIIKIGLSRISPLVMSVENTDKYYQQALAQAFKNAKDKATTIASQSGVSIAKLLYIKELSTNANHHDSSSMMISSEKAPNHISQTGYQTINASVLVKFSIQE